MGRPRKNKMGKDSSSIQAEIADLLAKNMDPRQRTGGSPSWWNVFLKISNLESKFLLEETKDLGRGTNRLLVATYILIFCTVLLLIGTVILVLSK